MNIMIFGTSEFLRICSTHLVVYEGLMEGEEHECDCEHCDRGGECLTYCKRCGEEYDDEIEYVCRLGKCRQCGSKFTDHSGRKKLAETLILQAESYEAGILR